MEQGQNEQNIPALGSGWPLSEISYKTEGGLLLAHAINYYYSKRGLDSCLLSYICLDEFLKNGGG